MEEKMNELIELIKSDQRYLNYKEKEKELKKVEDILIEYSRVMEEYQSLKQYESYIDTSLVKQKLKDIKLKMTNTKEIVEYYNCYHELNNYLDEITKLIFKDISDQLNMSQYILK